MSEQEKTEKPTAKPAARRGKTLSLKRTVESGQVRQSFSHGRFKSVLVEKRRKRIINPDQSTQKPAESETPPITENADSDKKNNFDSLSQSEQEARMAAVTEAKARAAEIAQQEEIERQQKEAQAAQAAQYKSAEDKSVKAEKTQADDIVSRKAKSVKSADFTPLQPAPPSQPQPTGRKAKEEKQEAPRKLAPTKRSEPRRRTGKLTINDALKNE
ncbi:MAG: translation initiation factor IF-2 associated domain-containing protein, partial [Alphaproteobacteria bacterium]|nr:translation initiation factor IF-2 associated domain-containing protein [Alphaproteobacteria bacterium]